MHSTVYTHLSNAEMQRLLIANRRAIARAIRTGNAAKLAAAECERAAIDAEHTRRMEQGS